MIDVTGLPVPPNAPPLGACVRLEYPEPFLVRLVLDPPHRSMPVFDLPLLRDLDHALDQVESDPDARGLVITGRDGRTFVAGADLDAIAALDDPAQVARVVEIGQRVFQRIHALSGARSRFSSVAAISGAAPGGAYELALACSFAIASTAQETRIGLPETQLGILPGWGGSTRLPRRVGVPKALEAILSGKLYSAKEALRFGLVDRLAAPEDLARIAADVALGRLRLARRDRGWAEILIDRNPLAASFVSSQARQRVLARTQGHYPAPLAVIAIVARAPRTSLDASFAAEREAVKDLAIGPVAKNLVRIFRLNEEAKKLDLRADGTKARGPRRVGVLGAGVMGRAIASLSAERGAWTRLFDIAPEALDAALLEHRGEVLARSKRRRLERHEADATVDRLDVTRDLAGFARARIVVEAVAERLEVKQKVFGELARQMAPDAILATNTSSLSVDAIADLVPHPERVVGLHFFNPVKRMPLVEIVRGARTSAEVVAECAAFALSLGKTPVVVRDCAGFLVNRLFGPYLDESLRLLAGGVDPLALDRSLRAFGMPMGPLELLDEVGFDIAAHAAQSLHSAYGERMTPSTVLAPAVADKRLGKKTGLGFYRHSKDGKKPVLSDDWKRFVPADAARCAPLADDAIAERVVLAMLAEGARALEERVVESPRHVDLATVFGMGFAPFRGGLLRWADALGTTTIVAKLEAIAASPDVAARVGGKARFTPPESLAALARVGGAFHGRSS